MRQDAIAIERASVRYPGARAEALCDASLTVGAGSHVALIGPNGAGKSTLLKAVVGLLPLARGRIQIFGGAASAARQRVAYVPQRSNVDWSFPICAGDVALMGRDVFIRWPRRPSAADRALAERALATVGMADLAARHIADLSGGQQQRVFLARALAQQADLLLLDEPFVGIDTATEHVIFGVLDRLRDEGRTVVVATHDLTTLESHFDRAALIHHTVVAVGSPAQVLQPDLLAGAYGGPLALFHGLGAAQQHAECAL